MMMRLLIVKFLALASPANQTEAIEKRVFSNLSWKEMLKEFKDKKIYLFGTFGWGTGMYMSHWIKEVEELGAKIVELPMACKGSPNSETREKITRISEKDCYYVKN